MLRNVCVEFQLFGIRKPPFSHGHQVDPLLAIFNCCIAVDIGRNIADREKERIPDPYDSPTKILFSA